MRYDLRPCRLGEALYVARRVPDDVQAKLRAAGMTSRRVFADYWRNSVECWVWRVDGEIAAVGGWCGMMLGREAEVWLALLPLARQHWRPLVRLLWAHRNRLGAMRLLAHVMADDSRAMRFAGFFGLRSEGEPQNGVQIMVG